MTGGDGAWCGWIGCCWLLMVMLLLLLQEAVVSTGRSAHHGPMLLQLDRSHRGLTNRSIG